jgi:hypothetical protein
MNSFVHMLLLSSSLVQKLSDSLDSKAILKPGLYLNCNFAEIVNSVSLQFLNLTGFQKRYILCVEA